MSQMQEAEDLIDHYVCGEDQKKEMMNFVHKFLAYDTGKQDGKLDKEEFSNMCKSSGASDADIEKYFRYCDSMGKSDGFITVKEIVVVLCASGLETLFRQLDTNGNGYLDQCEFNALIGNYKAKGYNEKKLEAAYAQWNTDGVGQISLDDFLSHFCNCCSQSSM